MFVHSTCCRAQWHIIDNDTSATYCRIPAPVDGWQSAAPIRSADDPPLGNICVFCDMASTNVLFRTLAKPPECEEHPGIVLADSGLTPTA